MTTTTHLLQATEAYRAAVSATPFNFATMLDDMPDETVEAEAGKYIEYGGLEMARDRIETEIASIDANDPNNAYRLPRIQAIAALLAETVEA